MSKIKLINGEAINELDKMIESKIKVDTIIIDSPYGINFVNGMKKGKQQPIYFDRNLRWLNECVLKLHQILKDNGHIYMFSPSQKIGEFTDIFDRYLNRKSLIVWDKKAFGMGDLYGSYAPSYEFILFGGKQFPKKLNGKRIKDIMQFKNPSKKIHPNQKPIELIKELILKSTNEGDTVLDCFMGSGTTGIAAKELNRNFIGIELDKKYFDIAKERIESMDK